MQTHTPTITLSTKAETLDWLASHDDTWSTSNYVKSLWLCEELNRFEADGYVYNSQAQERICKESGMDLEWSKRRAFLGHTRTEGGLLGTLVYHAQAFRREMKLESQGWKRATPETLAHFAGRCCLAIASGEMGGELTVKVKAIGNTLRLCPPRSRNKYYADYLDWWIKPCP